jgi:hypothetical protein
MEMTKSPDNGAQAPSQPQTTVETGSPSTAPQPAGQPLKGMAELGAVTAEGLGVRSYLISVCRARNFKCVLVHLKNGSGMTITVDGDNAKATDESGTVDPNTTKQISSRSCCGLSTGKLVTLAAVSVIPLLGLPEPILYEMMTNKRDWNHFYESGYGWLNDGPRHEIEGLRFGKRVLLPGDETDGWFCFKADQIKSKATLRIPVSSGTKSTIVEITVPDNALAENTAKPKAKPEAKQ